MPKKLQLVYIKWCDSISTSSWKDMEGAIEWADESNWLVENVGWILKETKEYICLASSVSHPSDGAEDQFSNLQKIPKTWIRKRRILKP